MKRRTFLAASGAVAALSGLPATAFAQGAASALSAINGGLVGAAVQNSNAIFGAIINAVRMVGSANPATAV